MRYFSNILISLTIAFLALCLASTAIQANGVTSDSLSGYSYVKSNTIAGSPDGSLSDYQMKFIIHSGNGSDSGPEVFLNGHSQSWPNDFRFADSENNILNYWVESSDTNIAYVWVKVTSIPTSGTTIKLYYGKSDDSSGSNGDNTFAFFDDFNGLSLDTNKWTRSDYGIGSKTLSVSRGLLTITAGHYAGLKLDGTSAFNTPVIIESSIKINYPSASNDRIRFAGSNINANPFGYDVGMFSNYNVSPQIYWNGWTRTAFSRNAWYRSREIFQPADQYTWNVEGVYTNSGSTPLTSIRPYLGVGDYPIANDPDDCGSVTVDRVSVRKYTPNEPTNGDWGKEQRQESSLCFGAFGLALLPLLLVGVRRLH